MLAPLGGTHDEHTVGANLFRIAELVFQASSAMRFTNEARSHILEAMSTAGGSQLSRAQWRALASTERRAEQLADASSERPGEPVCYHDR